MKGCIRSEIVNGYLVMLAKLLTMSVSKPNTLLCTSRAALSVRWLHDNKIEGIS